MLRHACLLPIQLMLACLASSAQAAPWVGQDKPPAATADPDANPNAIPTDMLQQVGGPEGETTEIAPTFNSNSTDPYVMLDEAKLSIGDGKLHRASAMLAMIKPDGTEAYVSEELLFQRLLLAGAFLNAAGSVLGDAQRADYASSKYADWLKVELTRYAQDYSELADAYLAATAGGLECDFVRFRLPRVTAEHLQDAVLYSDPQVLKAAVENWNDQRTGLGKGLIGTQARVALVLGAAAFYDLKESSSTIEGVTSRLRNGVPLDERTVLDWIAQTAADQSAAGGAQLKQLQATVDARLAPKLTTPGTVLRLRYDKRNGLLSPPPAEKPKAKSKRGKGKR